jgi:hypothetical protein
MSARLPLFTLALAVALAGCGADHKGARTDARLAGDPALCDSAVSAVEDGPLVGGTGDSAAATALGGWSAVRDGDCERVTLALLKGDGALQHAGLLHGALLRSYGIVRVGLPGGITAVADPDSAIDSPLVKAAYVVHARDGGWYEDLHLAQPALARLVALAGPGRIGVDLAPGGGAVPHAAPSARNVVVIEPRGGAARYPLVIRGYARTFEANVIARLSIGNRVLARAHGTAADYVTTWGEFELTIPGGPSGDVDLFVGEDSAQDGTPIGVTIPLRLP